MMISDTFKGSGLSLFSELPNDAFLASGIEQPFIGRELPVLLNRAALKQSLAQGDGIFDAYGLEAKYNSKKDKWKGRLFNIFDLWDAEG